LDKREIARLRLRSQRLANTQLNSADGVVEWLVCSQGQDYAPGKWSIGQRAVGLSDSGLDKALAEGRILRTHVLRPTWHFVSPRDVRWVQALTGPRVLVQNRHYMARLELTDPLLRRTEEILREALTGRRLTRPQVQKALADAGVVAEGTRLAYILMQGELECVITSGGLAGKQQTYALLDEIAPMSGRDAGPAGDEALAEFTRRYFTSHGPATVADFRWWSSLTVAEIKRGLDIVGSELEKRTIDGLEYWASTFDLPPGPDEPRAHFIQGLDEYFVGYQKTRSAADVAGIGPKGFDRGFYNTFVMDGQLAAAVRRVVERDGVTFEVRQSWSFTDVELAEAEAAAARYATFLNSEVRVKMVTG
jgi:hypothetical protein